MKTSSKTIIKLKDVWKTYLMGKVSLDVLRGINLNIYRGEFVAILGPSGSGKSTLMNQVGLLDVPSKGKITIDEVDISTLKESDLAQLRGKKIGFVFQQFNLIPALTALENVILPTIFQNLNPEERDRRAKELLALVGLADRMTHRPNELSGGQQQRVAIARALVNNPEIILADEPTGNLDTKSGEQVMELLLELHHKEHKTVILVTHDIGKAKHAERIVYLKDGEVERVEKRR
ncbi:MAG TPA: ABC transporter ATP-binding protein [Candidatus Nanoarchaeia archaeon]|nr:ABC transporter ATP-binding protein [Candidatus Nanoarchaeia archaeon]